MMSPQPANNLYPVFLQLNRLKVLVVGGGHVGEEKLNSLLLSCPDANITLVAITISDAIRDLAVKHPTLVLHQKPFVPGDLFEMDVVIAATNDAELNAMVKQSANDAGVLANIADTPELCDFYLGSIVNKGDLKIAISTNGKSPTIAKRLKELFNDAIPPEMDQVLDNMQQIRLRMNGNFADKVKKLNEITGVLVAESSPSKVSAERKWKKIASRLVLLFTAMIIGHVILSSVPLPPIGEIWATASSYVTREFLFFILAGFLAQLVDGLLGMGYGVTSATCLITAGVNPVAVSAAIHTSEIFSAGVSGYSHYRFGNVNRKLFKHLVIPGVIGAVLGAAMLVILGEHAGKWLMPIIALYAMFLGIKIFSRAFQIKQNNSRKIRRVGWLAWCGGFLDSFGGGGWGPIVTSTLISKGRSPRYTIGTVSLTEFFVTLASAATFFFTAGISHLAVVIGLLMGGSIAAPISAKLAGKLPAKTMMIGVGVIVMIWSIRLIVKTFL
ncbi:TSUP family transporter [Flavihumibacter petaseus]|uniref:Probable membrane transporter protein n=1 Tax=Flavihumibacter petaseus NBRC 106054 TaxID=1220578 RepID=A0A0E9N278_9BACT|nr:TSUP family transporter [Flavihumibacter petaseus]GAO43883.1 putative precorrin-2 dehydrogenase/sirohydrochlorin ferrochelatase [Flavihumibacter petaseus NBRC 106054]